MLSLFAMSYPFVCRASARWRIFNGKNRRFAAGDCDCKKFPVAYAPRLNVVWQRATLEGDIKMSGVMRPVVKELYQPILDGMKKCGISIQEAVCEATMKSTLNTDLVRLRS